MIGAAFHLQMGDLAFPLPAGAGALRGEPTRAPSPAAPHARPRPRHPRPRLSATGEAFITRRRRGGTPHSPPPARVWRPKHPQNWTVFFSSHLRAGRVGFSQGDPSTFAFPVARCLLPPYLSFREAEAVCQLFSLCSYYIMVLLKGMFQSQ